MRRGLLFSRPYGTGSSFQIHPGLASWAKFSRPCGTEFRYGVRTHVLEALFYVAPENLPNFQSISIFLKI